MTAVFLCSLGAALILPPSQSLAIDPPDQPQFVFFVLVAISLLSWLNSFIVVAAGALAAQHQAEAAQERAAFLTKVVTTLSLSPDDSSILADIADLALPQLADWITIDRVDPAGKVHRAIAMHRDPAKASLMQQLLEDAPALDSSHPIAKVLRSGIARNSFHNPAAAARHAPLTDNSGLLDEASASSMIVPSSRPRPHPGSHDPRSRRPCIVLPSGRHAYRHRTGSPRAALYIENASIRAFTGPASSPHDHP